MGSNKKNTSKSKAGIKSAERVAASDIELKVADDVPAESGDVGPVAEVPVAETPVAETPVEETPVEETPAADAPAEPECAKSENAAPAPDLFAGLEQSAGSSAPTPNLSLHASAIPLSLRSEMSVDWPLSRKRQLFNVAYFGIITLQLVALTQSGMSHWAGYLGLFVCGLLATASIFYLFNHRHHQTSSEDFSPRTRRSLRAIGLLIPAFLMFALVKSNPVPNYPAQPDLGAPFPASAVPAVGMTNLDFKGEMALGKDAYKRHRYDEALSYFQKAAAIDPQADLAPEWMAQTYDSSFNFPASIAMSLHAIDLNPNNENAHLTLGHGYNMTGRFNEAVDVLQTAIKLDPSDGEAYGYLSRAFSGLGDYNQALANDNMHVKSHWYESRAFEQKAETLDNLGRNAEARYVREFAEKVRQSTHH